MVKVLHMKKCISIAWLFLSVSAYPQALRDINYAYQYNPDEPFSFSLRPVIGSGSFTILYSLQVKDTAGLMNEYSIQWEARNMLIDKEGTPVVMEDHVMSLYRSGLQGRVTIRAADAPKFIVAKVVKNSL